MSRPTSPSFVISSRPMVALFADCDVLALSLLEKLLANFCRVKIFTDNIATWQEKTLHLGHAKYFSFVSKDAFNQLSGSAYAIYINFYPQSLGTEERVSRAIARFSSENFSKALFILPYFLETEEQKKLCTFVKTEIGGKENLGGVYIGQIISPRMALHRGILFHELLNGLVRRNKLQVPQDNFEVYPTFAVDVAREIVKSLFSFGYFGQEVAMYSATTTIHNFVSFLARLKDNIGTIKMGEWAVRLPGVDRKIQVTKNLESFVPETVDWFTDNPAGLLPELKPKEIRRVERAQTERQPAFVINPRVKKFLASPSVLWGFVAALFVLFLPAIFMVLGVTSLAVFGKTLLSGNFTLADSAASVATFSSMAAKKESNALAPIPFVGRVYRHVATLSGVMGDTAAIASRSVSIAREGKELARNILGKESFNLANQSEGLSLDLDVLYKELGFLQGEIDALAGLDSRAVGFVSQRVNISQTRQSVFFAKTLAQNLPGLLGADKQTSYLVLLQNNMELRPTGGFIGSYAIITFDQGKLIDTNVSDVYAADGQLQGHVEPPAPIKKYLGEANWYLRDSNWDPDFPTSAARAEWFLGKEIGKSVDGVIGLDLEFIRGLVGVAGPLALPDYNETISASDLYQKTQSQVEKDFFPGSQKKTNYLTALARALLGKLDNPKDSIILGFSKEAIRSLESKHVQVFVHNRDVQNSLSDLAWDGAVSQPACEGNCYPDWFGIVDANVGVNKANYYIERSAVFNVRFNGDNITRELTITLKNNANPALGQSARYKDYLRVLAPKSSDYADVAVSIANGTQSLKPEINQVAGRSEAGVLVEIPAGQKGQVKFVWQTPLGVSFAQPGEYRLYIRKQAGTITDAIDISQNFPDGIVVKTVPIVYNTSLAADIFIRSRW